MTLGWFPKYNSSVSYFLYAGNHMTTAVRMTSACLL
jgi:hypothetical protein